MAMTEKEQLSVSDARKLAFKSVYTLAVHDGSVAERLLSVWTEEFGHLAHLPPRFEQRFDELNARVTSQTSYAASITAMGDAETLQLVHDMISFAMDIAIVDAGGQVK